MNRVKLKVLPIVLMATLLAVGCAGQQGGTNLNPPPTTKILEQVPIWVENVPKDPNYLFASGTETSRKMSLALDKAKTGARRELAQQMEVHVEGLTKAFDEEIGLGADSELLAAYTQTTKIVIDQTLIGTIVERQKLLEEGNGIYRSYVLMSLPIGEANLAMAEKIKANEMLYTRFRASQAFQDLEAEVEKYRTHKKEQEESLKMNLEDNYPHEK